MDPKSEPWYSQLGTGALGALSATLTDLPMLAFKKLQPEMAERLASMPGYKKGHTIGTGTSSLPALMLGGPGVAIGRAAALDPTARAFIAGTAQANLMGAPEFLAKKVFGAEKVADWKKENAGAYGVGNLAGALGSAAIPVGGILKGAGAAGKAFAPISKAFGAAQAGLKGLKGGAFIAPAVGSAIEGALQAGTRAAFDEKKPGQVVGEALTGGAMGGLVGGAFGALGKLLPGKSVRGALDEVGDKTRWSALKSISPSLNGRSMNKYMNFFAGKGASMIKRGASVDDAQEALLNFARKNDIASPYDMKKFSQELLGEFKKADQAFESVYGGVKGSDLVDSLAKRADFGEIIDSLPDKNPEAVAMAFDRIKKAVGGAEGLANIRQFVRDELDAAFDSATLDPVSKRAIMGTGHAILDSINGLVGDAVEATGTQLKKPFGQLLQDYKYAMPLSEGVYRAANMGAPAIGSTTQVQTTAKDIAKDLLARGTTGAGLGVLAGGTAPGDTRDKITAGLVGAGAGMLGGPMLSRGLTKIMGKGAGVAEAVAGALPGIGQALEAAAPIAGRLAARGANVPPMPEPTDFGQLAGGGGSAAQGGAPGQAPQGGTYQDRVAERLTGLMDAYGIDPAERETLMSQLYQATGGFSPQMTAGLMYPNPEERKAFLQSIRVNESLGNLGTAMAKPGLIQGIQERFTDTPAEIERKTAGQSIISTIQDAAAKSAGIPAKTVQTTLNSILNGRGSLEDKKALLEVALKNWGLDIDELERMGIA